MFNDFTLYPCLALFVLCIGQTVLLLLAKHRGIAVKKIRKKNRPHSGHDFNPHRNIPKKSGQSVRVLRQTLPQSFQPAKSAKKLPVR